MDQFKLGEQVRDRVTGFAGTVTGYARYLYKQDEFLVENTTSDGPGLHAFWMPAARLEPLGEPDAIQAERQRFLLNE